MPTKQLNEIQDIRDARDYSEAIVEAVREPLVILDHKLHVISANKAFYRVFHTTKKETRGVLIYKLGTGQWNDPKLKHLLKDILTRKTWFDNFKIEHNFPLIGDRIFLLNARRISQTHANRMLPKKSQSSLILLAIEDVTEKLHLERQKDDFISIASHELRTPVTSIKVYGQLLQTYPLIQKDKKASYLLSKMDSQLVRLNELVASFVNVYKLQSGKLRLHKKSFLMDDLVKEVVGNFQYSTSSHYVKREGSSKASVFADKARIHQVLINLISNAIKYSPDAKNVIVHLSSNRNTIKVVVQDFGMGVPRKEYDKIFERFYRTQGKKESVPGLGLGLFITNEIIKQHKGKLSLVSEIGKGSSFQFSLPVAKKD